MTDLQYMSYSTLNIALSELLKIVEAKHPENILQKNFWNKDISIK